MRRHPRQSCEYIVTSRGPAGPCGEWECDDTMLRHRIALAAAGLLLPAMVSAAAPARVVFLPFEDKVKLKEAWNLGVDVPRWFSETVDTLGPKDSLLQSVNFDAVQALIAENRWRRGDYTAPITMQGIAARLDARFVVTGTVERFKVIKRALTGDGSLGGTHGTTSSGSVTSGVGGAPVTAGLQSYSARVRIAVAVHEGRTGALLRSEAFDLTERDGGLKLWLSTSPENDEMNFYHMSRSPFGSVYFQRNVIGAIMKQCSERLRQALASALPQTSASAPPPAREFLEGRILDRVGNDVYVNLGSGDNLLLGEELEVLRPERPVLGDKGDTLGWSETPAGAISIRSIKSAHFSQATVEQGGDSVQVGWNVRARLGGQGSP
jgi:hypothetical protein